MEKNEIKVCKHCVMNTTDTNLVLDENGVCDRCHDYEERILPWWNHGNGHEEELKNRRTRLADSIETALKAGEGFVTVVDLSTDPPTDMPFSAWTYITLPPSPMAA